MQIATQGSAAFQNPLGASPIIFPIIECFHIAGFILTIGTIALVDFLLLRWLMRNQTPAELAEDTSWWTLAGLILVVCSGLLLYSGDPDQYYTSVSFLVKMACLIFALFFHYTVQRKVVLEGASDRKARVVAYISLGSWAAVIFGAIFIAFGPSV
jgi:hypothetical protein